MTRRAQSRLANYSWPGNIRELENVIGNACMMVDGPVIDVGDLPEEIRGPSRDLPSQDDMLISLEELQKRHTHACAGAGGGQQVAGGRNPGYLPGDDLPVAGTGKKRQQLILCGSLATP